MEKGIKTGEETWLATLGEDREDGGDDNAIPLQIKNMLEFKEVLPPELPKKLPPRREVDHQIELEPGIKPPAKAPYRMSPPDLEELRRKLKELLDIGFIQPSKSPFGSPLLFQKKVDGSRCMCIDYRAQSLT